MRKPRKHLPHRAEKQALEFEYCEISGKRCFTTRGEAEKAARSVEKHHKGNGISVYQCDCGCYHITRCGYEMSKNIRQNKLGNSGVLYA